MSFEKEIVSSKYIILIKDTYDRIITNVKISGCITHRFPVTRFKSRISFKHV